MIVTRKPKQEPIYHPVCFHCGTENDLKPYKSYRWGTWHICRNCEIEAEKVQAARLALKAKRGK